MKLIQDREMQRIYQMIGSEDQELRALAIRTLQKKELIRFSFLTIVYFHSALFLLTLTGSVWLSYYFKLGWYLLPMIVASIMQLIGSIYYLMTVAENRRQYNEMIRKLFDNF